MNTPLLEICLNDLFSDISVLKEKYQSDTVNSIIRVRDMYLWLVQRPSAKDAEFVKEECGRHKVSRPTAYADLNLIKALMPNLSKASQDFNQWRFVEMILETYNIAKIKKDVRTMERSAASFAKYTGIGKDIEEKLPLDKIIVQPFVPTDDPTVLGFTPIPNLRERVKDLIKKYSRDVPEITDIDFEEADINVMPDADTSVS